MNIITNNLDFTNVDWVGMARELGIKIPGHKVKVELTRLGTPYQQYKVAVQLVSYLIQNNLPIDFLDEQLNLIHSEITTFDRACVKFYAKRAWKQEVVG
jgi:hypothetical protein